MTETGLPRERGGAAVAEGCAAVADPGPLLRRSSRCWFQRSASTLLLPGSDAIALLLVLIIGPVRWASAIYALAVLGLLAGQGQHRLRICPRVSDQVPRIATSGLVPVPLCALWLSAGSALLLGACAIGAIVGTRVAVRSALRAAHRRDLLVERALLLGAGPVGVEVARLLDEHPELGLRVRGFLDGGPPGEEARAPLLGPISALREVVVRCGITRVIICSGDRTEAELAALVRSCRPLDADVCVVPRLHELGMSMPRGCLDEAWGVPLVPLRHHTASAALIKRAFDLLVGGLLVVVLAPLLLALVVLVRAREGRGAFFKQLRVSKAGRSVQVVKLRTVRSGEREEWSVRREQCTALARWLRGTHLDELPQLLMVLRGEMSLVGPRPERPHYAMRFAEEIPGYGDRHRMPGGMTGWAQVHGLHGDTSIRDRARFDNQYIEYWSLWTDVVVVARTCVIVLIAAIRSPGVRRTGSGEDHDESSARDHGVGRRRGGAAAAVDAPAHSP